MATYTINQQQFISDQELYNYFVPPPPPRGGKWIKTGTILLIIGVSCSMLSSAADPGLTFVESFFTSLLLFGWPLAVGIIIRVRTSNISHPMPTDEEYNDWVNSWRSSLRQQGQQKLGLTPADIIGDILYVRGIVWPNSQEGQNYRNQGSPVWIKHGESGLLHASIYRFTFFYPTQHSLAIFSCDVNALHPLNYQKTQTYFYQDIVGIETHERSMSLDSSYYGTQRFEVHISNGEILSSTIYAPETPVERIVTSLRTLLRDKKYGTNGGGRNYAGY